MKDGSTSKKPRSGPKMPLLLENGICITSVTEEPIKIEAHGERPMMKQILMDIAELVYSMLTQGVVNKEGRESHNRGDIKDSGNGLGSNVEAREFVRRHGVS